MKLLTTALALATAMGTSLSAQASDTITVEDIPKIKSVIQTAISPDGEQVAFTRSLPRELYVDKNGYNYSELYVVDDEGVERPFITGKVNIKSISWSADGQDIYFLAKLGEDKHTALYHIPVDGGQAQQVFALKGRSISSYELSPTGKQVAILAMPSKDKSEKELKKLGFMAEVYEQGLKNKQLHLIDLAKADKPLDPEAIDIDGYVSDMNYADDGSKLLVKTQPTALIDDKYMKSQWHLFDVQSKAVTLSFKTEGKLGDAELSHDGRYVAILGAEDKHDPATGRLYLADTQSGEIKEWLPDFMGHIADIEWANTENTLNFIAAVSPETFVGQIEVGDEDYDTLIEQGEFIASRLSVSDSDKTIALRANTAKHPNEVFMIRGDEATRLSDSNPWLNDKRFAKQQALSFEARDGVEIGGVLVYPLDYQEGQRYPLIMAVHGGPESHDKNGWVTSYSDPGQMGAARGYAVFYPNYRGSTGKGVAYSKLGQNDYAGKEFDDLVDMKQYLVKMGLVDSDRVGITGGSYGGYASAWGATKLTEHFAASVMFVGVTNQLSKFGTTDISNEMYLVHARSYPWEKWQWYLERSPIYWAGQSKTPLLIMHGKDDPRVHPAQSMELYRYMKVQGKDVRLVYYPGEGHGNRRVAAQYDYSLRLMRWMDNYLMEGNKDMPDYKIDHASKLKAVKDANKAD
ncbi:Prolyl tripeptidyl peptidase precursor (plasmid) [Pseudoalteromonas sp. THAF3]|uniref:Peptidase S9 n=1 Tax=Pseudoalteromonas ruthenica TaxID=151081 RepID=A0A0F4Q4A1_9GAMM|nr:MULTISPECIES: S9 family peptidase [Pseudoalteromonas]KJY98082.1 peptidase S9 [Pseudoalteromonas ruthenica]KJZ02149.1 peptidase S9 [Pseudoalteromonas ruthenica]QFU06363.1 Prolyl tripeptidyl peptidase precursor [Pseudoalteromonas sp. THAF3]TMO91971.1 S9 family peptidase [Pseudoalteromonas ruthenica]TMO99646.1 S9 family peptidase [Pseudoalteromonas ruthenica]